AALTLAKALGGGRDALVRIDCNTLAGASHDGTMAVSRLLGVPAGYVGYVKGQGGLLSRVRDTPEAVGLFDEMEKAPPKGGELLLQILDEGTAEDSDGNRLDFRRTFIVFTTNAGWHGVVRRSMGFGAPPPGDLSGEASNEGDVRSRLLAVGIAPEL